MKPKKVYFDSLVTKSRNHEVRTKVISKKTTEARSGKQKFQRLFLVDEKGLTMKAVLFGQNVDHFDEIISEGQCYDMSNVVVSLVDPSYQAYPEERQLHINTSSTIKKVELGESSSNFTPRLTRISEIPREHLPHNATFDMVMVILHFTPPRKVPNKLSPTPTDLSELYVTDDSCSDPVLLSLWNEFAFACTTFGSSDLRGSVICATGLRTKAYKGFSLSTTSYTKLDFSPVGTRIEELRKWFLEKRDTVLAREINMPTKKIVPSDTRVFTIEQALAVKAEEITNGEMVRIAAYVTDFTADHLRLSVSCNWCSKVCDVPPESSYFCDSCANYALSTPKLFFDFTATDGTGTIKLAANTRTAEQLLKTKPTVLYSMSTQERASFTDTTNTALRAKKTNMVLTPVTTLLEDHKKVVWTLKEIL